MTDTMWGLPKIDLTKGVDTLSLPKIELKKNVGMVGQDGRVSDANKDLFDLYESNSQSSSAKIRYSDLEGGPPQRNCLIGCDLSLGITELLRECKSSSVESPPEVADMIFEDKSLPRPHEVESHSSSPAPSEFNNKSSEVKSMQELSSSSFRSRVSETTPQS